MISAEPLVTLIVVPRERFGVALRSLESIYANTQFPFRLIYVDAGSPAAVARALAAQAKARGFELLRVDSLLAPNEARNLVRRVPSADEVADWIEQAKALPRLVAH